MQLEFESFVQEINPSEDLKYSPVGTNLPNNKLAIFYLKNGQIQITESKTDYGLWQNLTFSAPELMSWDENVELLTSKYISGAYTWLTWHLINDKKHRVALYPTPDKYRFEPIKKPNLYLAKPNREIIGILNNAYNIVLHQKLGGVNELSFALPYEIDLNNSLERELHIDNIRNYYLIKLGYENVYYGDWFVINPIQDNQNADSDDKTITCYCLSHQLSHFILRDYLAESKNPQQLLDEILEVTPWRTGMISKELEKKFRTYETTSTNILDFLLTDVAETLNCYVIFDSEEMRVNLIHADKVGDYVGLNFLYDNYLNTLNKNSDPQEFCTRLKPYGQDNLTINEANPTGQNYIFDYSYFMYPFERDVNKNVLKSSNYMSDSLCHAILDYQDLVNSVEGVKTIAGLQTTTTQLNVTGHGLIVGDYILNKTRNNAYRKVLTVIDANLVTVSAIEGQTVDDVVYLYKDGTFRKLLYQKNDIASELIVLNGQLYDLETQKTTLLDTIAVKQEQGIANEDIPEITELATVESQITAKKSEITALLATDPTPQIEAMKTNLSLTNNFTAAQLSELRFYIKEKEWSNESIYDSIDLYEEGLEAFKEINKPKIDFTIDIVNFVKCLDEEFNKDKLVLADRVKIKNEKLNIDASAKMLEISYDFEKESIQIRLANPVKEILSPEDKFVQVIGKSIRTTSLLTSKSAEWSALSDTIRNSSSRIAEKPASPILQAITHEVNTDGSVNIVVQWAFDGAGNEYIIDGFVVYVRTLTTNQAYTFGSSIAKEQLNPVPIDKRAFQLLGVPANNFYTIGVQAYRNVDIDISSNGILRSNIVQNTTPYQPETTVGVSAHTLLGHTISGLTAGTFLKATGEGSYGFVAHGLGASDVGALPNLSGISLPQPSEQYRGLFFTVLGADGVADAKHICLKLSDNTYAWVLI